MKKTRLFLTALVIALTSSFQSQAQCNTSNYEQDVCDELINNVAAPIIDFDKSVLTGDAYYLHSSVAGHPWGQTTNPVAMDAVFGAGNWTQEFFETAVPATLFSSDTSLIYIDGSDSGADALNVFVAANGAAMEAWVNAGGSLFINAATQNPNVAVGFDDILLTYQPFYENVEASDATHQAFIGPLTTGTNFSGPSFSHNVVTGTGLTSILIGTGTTDMVLAEGLFGDGYVLVGGMTTTNFHSPAPDATNFRTNLLFNMANAPEITACQSDETVGVVEGETFTLPDYVANGDVIASNATLITQDPIPGTEIASSAGTQTVTFTAENNSIIIDSCSFVLTIDEVLGVQDSAINFFSMSPNPTSTSFEIDGDFTVAKIVIYNLLGQTVLKVNTNSVDVTSLETGMYLVTVIDTEGHQATKRLMKK